MENVFQLVLLLLILPVCLYLAPKLFRLFLVLIDYMALLSTAFGGLSHGTSNISVFVCTIDWLSNAAFEEQLEFLQEHGGMGWTGKAFRESLTKTYTRVVLMRRPTDGSLQGLLYLGKERGEMNGRKYTLLKVGPFVLNKEYQRSPVPLLLLVHELLVELVLHPTRSVYFIGKCITYKSYLSGMSKTNLFYPRYDVQTPEFESELVHRYASQVREPGDEYHRDTFILETEEKQIKTAFSFITKEDLRNPHIQFFVQQNPGWSRGHSLIGIGQITLWQILLLIHRTVGIILMGKTAGSVGRGAKRKVETFLRRIPNRSLSFQSELGRKQVLELYKIHNGLVDHRGLSKRALLDSVSEEDEYDCVEL